MYAALFSLLPGPLWLRIVLALATIAGVLALCVFFIFPFVNSLAPTPDVTVGG